LPRALAVQWASIEANGVLEKHALGESLAKTTALSEASVDVSVFAERPQEIQASRPGSKRESKNSAKDAPVEVAKTKPSLLGRALPVSLASIAAEPGMAMECWLELVSKSGRPLEGEVRVSLKVIGDRKEVRAALSLPPTVDGEEKYDEEIQEPVSEVVVADASSVAAKGWDDDDATSESTDRTRRARLAKENATRLRDALRQANHEGTPPITHQKVENGITADSSVAKEAALKAKLESENQWPAIYDTLAAAAATQSDSGAEVRMMPQLPPSPPRMTEAEVAAANALALYKNSIRGAKASNDTNRHNLMKTTATTSPGSGFDSMPPEMMFRLSQLAINGPAKKRTAAVAAAAAAASTSSHAGGKIAGGPAIKVKLASAVPRVPLRDGSAQHASLQHSRTHGILPLGANVSASTQLEAHASSDREAVATLLSKSGNKSNGGGHVGKRARKDPRAATALSPLARAVLPKLSIMIRKRLLSKRFEHWRCGWQYGWQPASSFSIALRRSSNLAATDWLNFGRGDMMTWRVARDATATRLQQALLLAWRIKRARAWRVVAHAALQQERETAANAYASAESLAANLEATAAAQQALEEEAVATIERCWHAWSRGPRVLRLALRGHLALAARNFARPPLNHSPPSAEFLSRALTTRAQPLLSPYDHRLLHIYPPPLVETKLKTSSPPNSREEQMIEGEHKAQMHSLSPQNQSKKPAASSFVELLKAETKPGSLTKATSPSGGISASINKSAPAFEDSAVVFAEKLAFAEALDFVAQTCAALYPHVVAKQPKRRRRNPQRNAPAYEGRIGSSSSKRGGSSSRGGHLSSAGATFTSSSLSGYHDHSSWWVLIGLPCLEYAAKLAAMPVKNRAIRPLMGAPPVAWLTSLKLCQALLQLERATATVELREWPKRRAELWLMRHEEERQRVMESFDHGALHKAQEMKTAQESQRQKEAAREAARHKAYFREVRYKQCLLSFFRSSSFYCQKICFTKGMYAQKSCIP